MEMLVELRLAYDRPMPVISSYRPPPDKGNHSAGRAVDVNVWGADALDLIVLALKFGFAGIGVDQKGPRNKRFVHLDNLPNSETKPRPWVWTY